MKITSLLTLGLLTAGAVAPVAMAADTMSADQQKQIETVVHDYLVNHPEVLIEASQALQKQQQQNVQQQAKAAINENANQLFSGSLAVAGNPKGNVTLVEFFDYQCIHCKKMATVINALVKKDNNLRVIYKEFPIFGDGSEFASQAALAAAMQGKYQAFHEALLKQDKRLDNKLVLSIAKAQGLNMVKLQKDMKSSTVTEVLETNRKLAEKMHLMGTPAFVVASTPGGQFSDKQEPAFIPGAASMDVLQDLIKKMNG